MIDVWPLHQKGCRTNAWHLYVIRFLDRETRDKVQDQLRICGVGTGVHYLPNYKFKPYENCIRIDGCPQAEEFYQVALTLPMHMYLTDEDVKEVVWLIGEAVNGN
jgi:dTDP-4-amino-4,6-dideoxygalactose transaminase